MASCLEKDIALEPVVKRQRVEELDSERLLLRFHCRTGRAEFQNGVKPPLGAMEPNDMRTQLQSSLEQWERLHQREEQLIKQTRQYLLESPSTLHHQFLDHISSFMEHRATTLGALLESPLVPIKKIEPEMLIVQQPAKALVVDRTLAPGPSVEVLHSERKSFTVSVSLLREGSKESIDHLLCGNKRLPIDGEGKAVFESIKITGISHRQQPFCLLFSLEEDERVIAEVKSQPFTVTRSTNRNSKRRREEEESKCYGSTSSDEDYVQSSPRAHVEQTEHRGTLPEYNYVDITDFLTLPQKEAATRLGISESMLCKRFKECTRRKWPYRYVRKIDKVIGMLCAHQDSSPEDKKKLEKLVKEREERLQPVKIRITAHDRAVQAPLERSPSPTDSPMEAVKFDDEEQFVLETLEMLKTRRSPKDAS